MTKAEFARRQRAHRAWLSARAKQKQAAYGKPLLTRAKLKANGIDPDLLAELFLYLSTVIHRHKKLKPELHENFLQLWRKLP